MPFHWCMDETLALMAMLPFIGMFFRRMHAWWHAKFSHKCHEKTCDDKHVEHTEKLLKKEDHFGYPKYVSQEKLDTELKELTEENVKDS
jgi:hypothetical protein